MKASFEVRPDLAFWASDAGKFESGQVHEVEGAEVIRLVAAAESAGSLVNVQYDGQAGSVANAAVESQEDSEAALEKAMGDIDDDGHYTGPWAVGNAALADLADEGGEIEIGSES